MLRQYRQLCIYSQNIINYTVETCQRDRTDELSGSGTGQSSRSGQKVVVQFSNWAAHSRIRQPVPEPGNKALRFWKRTKFSIGAEHIYQKIFKLCDALQCTTFPPMVLHQIQLDSAQVLSCTTLRPSLQLQQQSCQHQV